MKKVFILIVTALIIFVSSVRFRDGGGDFSESLDTLVSALSENPVAAEVFCPKDETVVT